MLHAVLQKIRDGEGAGDDDVSCLAGLLHNTREVAARTEFVREGDSPTRLRVLMNGIACSFKILENGKRTIVGYLLPGDVCDFAGAMAGRHDCSVLSLVRCVVADIPIEQFHEVARSRPSVGRALCRAALLELQIVRAWLVCSGRRTSAEHLAHFICEYVQRVQSTLGADEDNCPFPMTHEELADTLGITPVHVSRTMQQLRDDGYIEIRGRAISILNMEELWRFAQFDPAYLHGPC